LYILVNLFKVRMAMALVRQKGARYTVKSYKVHGQKLQGFL